MPSPPFVTLPEGVRPAHVETTRGTFATLTASSPDGSGRTALLVPGYTGSKENLIAILRPLAEAGHPVLAMDMRGQFETRGPDDASAYTVEALAEDVAAIVEALQTGPVHLVGHSFGGLVARTAAMARPGHLASLALLASGPGAIGGARAGRARELMSALRTMTSEEVWEAMEDVNVQDPVAAERTPEIIDFQRRRFFETSAASLLGMGEAILSEPDRVEELATAVTCPILVAYGEDDDAWSPREQAHMAERLGARRAVIPGGGHNPPAEDPETTVRVLREFWAEVEAAHAAEPA